MNLRNNILVLMSIFWCFNLFAQDEIITTTNTNHQLYNYLATHKQSTAKRSTNYIKLPFYDDFSRQSIFVQDSLWIDRNVFVNNSFCINPISVGVATLDAVNDSAASYPNAGSFPFIADYLTSQSIRLDSSFGSSNSKITLADSIYFSFYYQPQGLGNAPEEEDSLIVQFFNPSSNTWNTVWSTEGMSFLVFKDSFNVDFRFIDIPILNNDYLNKEFKFRFKNYASLTNNMLPSWGSNADQWNIDYVYLNTNRSKNDFDFLDFALVQSCYPLLKNYTSMPWNQFLANTSHEMESDSFRLKYSNLSSNTKVINQFFDIQVLLGNGTDYQTTPANIANINMPPFSSFTFANKHNYTFNSDASPYADFSVNFRIEAGSENISTNNQRTHYQRFYNYYSYDDGTPEAGYGLAPAGSKLAYQFKTNVADSLRSIQIYFNEVYNSTQNYFFLVVWDDNNGQPGNVVYEKSGVTAQFPNGLFDFYTYVLDEAVPVNSTFYIGWRQQNSINLNVGFDKNNDASSHIFYNVGGGWLNSQYEGALMIRPILGSDVYPYVGIENTTKKEENITVYPNPANDIIHLSSEDNKQLNVQLFDIYGKFVFKKADCQKINTSELRNGVYILRITDDKNQLLKTSKITICH